MATGDKQRTGLEPWAFVAIVVAFLVAALFVTLGLRPGAPLGPWLYLQGTAWLFLFSALLLVAGIIWSVLHRPVLSRRRILPFALMGASVWMTSLPFPYPSSHKGGWSPVAFQLPFEGDWRVRWGGERRRQNALVFFPARRFGFDFVAAEGSAFGLLVTAPCAGRVVVAEADHPDHGPRPRAPFGNCIVLEVAPERFLVLGNLEQGSLLVKAGEIVAQGGPLARVGDSAGTSLEGAPQLMVHLQDNPLPGRGEGVPMRFRGYEVAGRTVSVGVPIGGMEGRQPVGQIVRSLGLR